MSTKNPFSGGGWPSAGPSGAIDETDSPAPPAGGVSSGREGGDTASSSGAAGQTKRIRALVDPAKDLACARLPLTDLGNAERWRVRFGEDFRFCPEIGWFAWDGRRWELLSEERDKVPARVLQSVFVTVRAIRNEAALVAASGGLMAYPVPEKVFPLLSSWADQVQGEGRDKYLRGDEDGEREQWLDGLEGLDFVVDFSKRKALSSTIMAWAKTSEGVGKLSAVANIAKAFDGITIAPTAMDADRMAINVLNGTLRLVRRNVKRSEAEKADWLRRHGGAGVGAGPSTGSGRAGVDDNGPQGRKGDGPPAGAAQRSGANSTEDARAEARAETREAPEWKTEWTVKKFPHAREDLISKLAPVKYSANATCPTYDAFMARVQPDEHMRRFIHQWGGLSLTGDIGEHKLAFFFGGGRNGKGTWVELVAAIAGDYAGTVQFESLADNGTKRRGDQATPDLAKLPGIRFLRISEPGAGTKFDDGLLKQLTGGDPVEARFLNKGFFEFLPSFKITISGNNRPATKDTSHGFWSRMQLVPWSVTIPEDEIDHRLPERLRGEASGVLNRLIEGLLDWRREGLIVPDAVRMATRTYRDQSDDLGRFLAQCCLVSDGDDSLRVGAKELFDVFEAWADQVGGAKWSMKGFKKAMEDRGFEQKSSNGMKWLKVALRPGVTPEAVKAGNLPDLDGRAGQSGGGAGETGQGAGPKFHPDEPVPGFD